MNTSELVKLRNPLEGEEKLIYRVMNYNEVTKKCYISPINSTLAMPGQELVHEEDVRSLRANEIAKIYGTTEERIKKQFADNAAGLKRLLDKAKDTGKKVNGYTEEQLTERYEKYLAKSL